MLRSGFAPVAIRAITRPDARAAELAALAERAASGKASDMSRIVPRPR